MVNVGNADIEPAWEWRVHWLLLSLFLILWGRGIWLGGKQRVVCLLPTVTFLLFIARDSVSPPRVPSCTLENT